MTAHGQVGAFFDLDGTLLSKPSLEWRFASWLLSRRHISNASATLWFAHFVRNICRNPRFAIQANKRYLAGVPVSFVADWAVSLEPESLKIFSQALVRISWHLAQEHRVFIVSGTLAPLARVVARRISPGIEVAATELQITCGSCTGALTAAHISGTAKRRAIQALVAKYDLRLELSYAYGNALADFEMLDCVGYPRAVNPTIWLRRIAQKRKWPISNWRPAPSSGKKTALSAARELA